MELTKDGDTYTLTSKSTFKDTTTNFKLGEEFDEETPDGPQRQVRHHAGGQQAHPDPEGRQGHQDRIDCG
ncbi:unnamed protein product [Bemisia tabaci]|uniref:Uncharacterized protein n=1 Tax=Bemisia tabaci TaxID=7038 RepID=A0A9P0EZE2_BEMTA|nr:unnamed protein product [Bemisia tabaci]